MSASRNTAVIIFFIALHGSILPAQADFKVISEPDAEYADSTKRIPITAVDYQRLSSIGDSILTLSFSTPMEALTVPNTWNTWASPPYTESATPRVLFTRLQTAVTLKLSKPVKVFGVEAEPNPYAVHTITATFKNGSHIVGTISRAVDGYYGARLFAASTTMEQFTSIELKSSATFAIAQIRYRLSSDLPNSILTITDLSGRPVHGIVCDNLRGMKYDLNGLIIKLDSQYEKAKVSGEVVNDKGKKTDQDGINNVGKIEPGTGQLTYYPPDEFNFHQEPSGTTPSQLTRPSWRKILLTVRFTLPNGKEYVVEPKTIYLARPPVLLVHGINSGPGRWRPLIDATRNMNLRVPFVAVDHSWIENGNGPVEDGASILRVAIGKVLTALRQGVPLSDGLGGSFGDYANRGWKLAAKRVDVIGWSYGGMITRWYIASSGDNSSRDWYRRRYEHRFGATKYNGDIRKFITLGSMWRGVPLCNYLNEVTFGLDFPSASGFDLGMAPVLGLANLRLVVNAIDASTPLKPYAPSMEVMAINSPWLKQLIYQDPKVSNENPRPFNDNIAYGSVAGDDNNYPLKISGVPIVQPDPHKLLHHVQSPSWYPYLLLEVREGSSRNYSDGIVPVWSAAIPGSYQITNADHSNYSANRETRTYLLRWLNNAALKNGSRLNRYWQDRAASRIQALDNGHTWKFGLKTMAPYPQHVLYRQQDGFGRINFGALMELNTAGVLEITSTSAVFRWFTLLPCRQDTVLLLREDNVLSVYTFDGEGTTHERKVTGLKPNTRYYWEVRSSFSQDGLQPIVISSFYGAVPSFKTRK